MALPVSGSAAQRLELTGVVDVHTVSDVRLELLHAIDSGSGELVVDLTRASFPDTTGLGMLLMAHRRARRAGRSMVLLGPPSGLSRLLATTRLDKVLTIQAA